ncbi:MAG TPA: hypothetical protein VMZ52_16330 [Bryobacteraceae bacterium]|nr:hypothetical protein [Bryobacteraceae bacterium]
MTTTVLRYAPYAAIVLSLILGARLFSTGLAKTYRWFTAYLIANLILTIVFYITPWGTNQYAITYFAAQPIRWILYFGMVFEMYRLVLREHPGIATFGRRWLIRALGLAAFLSLCTLFAKLGESHSRHPLLESYHVLERVVNVCLFLFLLLLLTILAWFPIQVKRNLMVLCSVFGGYILLRSALMVARNLAGPDSLPILNPLITCLVPLSMLVLIVLVSPSGEERRLKAGLKRPPATEKRILAQLDAINDTLSRSSKS